MKSLKNLNIFVCAYKIKTDKTEYTNFYQEILGKINFEPYVIYPNLIYSSYIYRISKISSKNVLLL